MGANPKNRHSLGSSRSGKINEDIEAVDAEKQFTGISEEEDCDEDFEATEVHMEIRDSDLAPLEEFEENKRNNQFDDDYNPDITESASQDDVAFQMLNNQIKKSKKTGDKDWW